MSLNSVDVLLAEDNTNDAKLTMRELKKHKLANNLVHVKDGAEALDFIFATGKYAGIRHIQYLPKLLLLDIKMPKVNGIEVLQKLKADSGTMSIPVVMLGWEMQTSADCDNIFGKLEMIQPPIIIMNNCIPNPGGVAATK